MKRDMSSREAAEHLRCSRSTLYRYIDEGLLSAVKCGTLWRVRTPSVHLLAAQLLR